MVIMCGSSWVRSNTGILLAMRECLQHTFRCATNIFSVCAVLCVGHSCSVQSAAQSAECRTELRRTTAVAESRAKPKSCEAREAGDKDW